VVTVLGRIPKKILQNTSCAVLWHRQHTRCETEEETWPWTVGPPSIIDGGSGASSHGEAQSSHGKFTFKENLEEKKIKTSFRKERKKKVGR